MNIVPSVCECVRILSLALSLYIYLHDGEENFILNEEKERKAMSRLRSIELNEGEKAEY
jgi:hypothetical protein